jgi:hypothetical protein
MQETQTIQVCCPKCELPHIVPLSEYEGKQSVSFKCKKCGLEQSIDLSHTKKTTPEDFSQPATQKRLTTAKETLPPHLTEDGSLKRCSVCGYPFPADVHPSMTVAFAEHLLKAHNPANGPRT